MERAGADGGMRYPPAVVLALPGPAKPAFAQAGGDHHGAAGMALALGGLDRPWAAADKPHDFAEAELDARLGRVVGELGGQCRSVGGALEVVQVAEIDQRTARRQFVEAERLQAGAGGFGGGGETAGRRAPAPDARRQMKHPPRYRDSALQVKMMSSA